MMRSGLRGISWVSARGGGTRWAWVLSFAGHAVFVGIGFLVVWSVEPGMRDPGPPAIASFYDPSFGGGIAEEVQSEAEDAAALREAMERMEEMEWEEPDLELLLAELLPGMEPTGEVHRTAARTPDLDEILADATLPQTQVYGVGSGNARSIVYVVDASGSMISAFPVVLRELMRSVEALSAMQEFQVVFYRSIPGEAGGGALSAPHPATPERERETRLIRATRGNIEFVRKWAEGVRPSGRSNPLVALETALALEPDAVFVLGGPVIGAGDYEVDVEQVLRALERLNPAHPRTGNRAVAIRTIELLEQDTSGILRAIAREHGGGEGSYLFLSREELFR